MLTAMSMIVCDQAKYRITDRLAIARARGDKSTNSVRHIIADPH